MTDRGPFPSPFEISSPPRLRGVGGAVSPHLQFAGAERLRGEPVLVSGCGARAEPYLPVRRRLAFESAWSRSTRRARACSSSRPRSASRCRILNGYVYLSGNSVTDEATIARRAELFESAGRLLLRALGRAVRAVAARRSRRRRPSSGARGTCARPSRGRVARDARAAVGVELTGSSSPTTVCSREWTASPVPLRVHEPRLRRLPRSSMSVCRQGVSGHLGPDDREDGRGHRVLVALRARR